MSVAQEFIVSLKKMQFKINLTISLIYFNLQIERDQWLELYHPPS
jgi:hypothetical protein